MTEQERNVNTETQQDPAAVPDETADLQASEPAESGSGEPAAKPRKSAVAVLALLLALIALLVALYIGWVGREMVSSANQRVTQMAGEVDAAPGRLATTIRGEMAAMGKNTDALQQQLGSVRSKVDRVVQEVSSLTTADRTDWMLAEVEYLLRLASQRVLMEGDLTSAEVILQAADRVLLELDDSRLHPVRRALAEDLAAVTAAGALDVEGIFLRLGATAEQVDALPLIVPSRELGAAREALVSTAAATGETTDGGDMGSVMERAWQQMKELVVVRQRSSAVRPLLPPDQEYYLRHNLRMLIEQARLGLLRNSNAVYQESLTAAGEWIREYFPLEDASVQAALKTLQEMARFDVSPRRPDVARGLRALQERQSARHWSTPSSGAQASKP